MDYELIKHDAQGTYDPTPFLNYARARRTDKQDRDADVGDVVHFWNGQKCLAAIVTEPGDWAGSQDAIAVLAPGNARHALEAYGLHSETKTEGTWHWPCGGQ